MKSLLPDDVNDHFDKIISLQKSTLFDAIDILIQ
jgi:hypothetical protein